MQDKVINNCKLYASHVLNCYKMWNKGNVPTSENEAILAVREYNTEFRSFKALFGYSIRGYVKKIAKYVMDIAESTT